MFQLEGTPVIDAAVGFYKKMYIEGTYMCLSFQQKKALPIGKGGAILLDNEEDYNILKRMSWDGRDASIPVLDDLNDIILGYHMNMTPDEAAKGVLLLNQYRPHKVNQGCWLDYPDLELQ
jgi:dTDP-4-amino-4,6-dideoxygalactose transaminase